jgi:hypothetical protein
VSLLQAVLLTPFIEKDYRMSIHGAGGRESYKSAIVVENVGCLSAFQDSLESLAGKKLFDSDGFRILPPNIKGVLTTTGPLPFILKFPSGNTLEMSSSLAKSIIPFAPIAMDLVTQSGFGVKVWVLY